jgi:hypothetical protein
MLAAVVGLDRRDVEPVAAIVIRDETRNKALYRLGRTSLMVGATFISRHPEGRYGALGMLELDYENGWVKRGGGKFKIIEDTRSGGAEYEVRGAYIRVKGQ